MFYRTSSPIVSVILYDITQVPSCSFIVDEIVSVAYLNLVVAYVGKISFAELREEQSKGRVLVALISHLAYYHNGQYLGRWRGG